MNRISRGTMPSPQSRVDDHRPGASSSQNTFSRGGTPFLQQQDTPLQQPQSVASTPRARAPSPPAMESVLLQLDALPPQSRGWVQDVLSQLETLRSDAHMTLTDRRASARALVGEVYAAALPESIQAPLAHLLVQAVGGTLDEPAPAPPVRRDATAHALQAAPELLCHYSRTLPKKPVLGTDGNLYDFDHLHSAYERMVFMDDRTAKRLIAAWRQHHNDPTQLQNSLRTALICPITQQLFRDPVLATNGFTYERAAIQAALSANPGHPQVPRPPTDDDTQGQYLHDDIYDPTLVANKPMAALLRRYFAQEVTVQQDIHEPMPFVLPEFPPTPQAAGPSQPSQPPQGMPGLQRTQVPGNPTGGLPQAGGQAPLPSGPVPLPTGAAPLPTGPVPLPGGPVPLPGGVLPGLSRLRLPRFGGQPSNNSGGGNQFTADPIGPQGPQLSYQPSPGGGQFGVAPFGSNGPQFGYQPNGNQFSVDPLGSQGPEFNYQPSLGGGQFGVDPWGSQGPEFDYQPSPGGGDFGVQPFGSDGPQFGYNPGSQTFSIQPMGSRGPDFTLSPQGSLQSQQSTQSSAPSRQQSRRRQDTVEVTFDPSLRIPSAQVRADLVPLFTAAQNDVLTLRRNSSRYQRSEAQTQDYIHVFRRLDEFAVGLSYHAARARLTPSARLALKRLHVEAERMMGSLNRSAYKGAFKQVDRLLDAPHEQHTFFDLSRAGLLSATLFNTAPGAARAFNLTGHLSDTARETYLALIGHRDFFNTPETLMLLANVLYGMRSDDAAEYALDKADRLLPTQQSADLRAMMAARHLRRMVPRQRRTDAWFHRQVDELTLYLRQ